MTQSITFGIIGSDDLKLLPGTDPTLLPNATDLPVASSASFSLSSTPYTVSQDGTETDYMNRVAATTTGFGTAAEHTTYDVLGPWNFVKNAALHNDAAANVTFSGFVHVDAVVGTGSDQGSTLELDGVKRGNLVTGAGDDHLDINVASNGAAWSNEFRIASGDGKDVVSAAVFDTAGAAAAGDATFASANATTLDYHYDGTATKFYMDLGAGDDAAKGLGGDDIIDGGTGSSFLTGGGGNDQFLIHADGSAVTWSTITDWNTGDQLVLTGWQAGTSTATWVENAGTAGFEGLTLHADLDGDGTIDTSITWTGLTLAQAPTETVQPDGTVWFA
ncbi:calcium-binding protein [Paracraurococcus lichenis]|uniref:Calcium-binding protein n=1 Tax=Paracraurococcus lichenis TaxID=3064888 RepID=A0ABT9E405_9PROT|nr:hypothetical protein [Paracraurococcus sp. LOR1-02]MDO9710899.1 hypothetical protein [Paracraurococcus sp. LOR1-02]